MDQTITVHVSGTTYEDCLNPNITQVPREIGIDERLVRTEKRGRGYRHVYEIPIELAVELLDHLEEMADLNLGGGVDPWCRKYGHAERKDADRLRKLIEANDRKASNPEEHS